MDREAMISGAFGDNEVWEEPKDTDSIEWVYIKDQFGSIIKIEKEHFEEFSQFLVIKSASGEGVDELAKKISRLDKANNLTDWERDFILSIKDKVKTKGAGILSDKQRAVIQRIYDEKCL